MDIPLWTLWFSGAAALATPIGLVAGWFAWRAHVRAVEPRDVVWSFERRGGNFVLMHDGSTRKGVRDVKITLTIEGSTERFEFARADRGEPLTVSHAAHLALINDAEEQAEGYARELAEWESRRDVHEDTEYLIGNGLSVRPPIPFAELEPIPDAPLSAVAEMVIVWTYPSGAADRQDLSRRLDY